MFLLFVWPQWGTDDAWLTDTGSGGGGGAAHQILGGAAPVLPWRRHAPMLPQATAQATPPLLQPDLLLSLLPASWSGLACSGGACVNVQWGPIQTNMIQYYQQ
jgi:hypothetical protein